jgi:hypothetical protein
VTWSAQPTICGQHSETATDWGQRDAQAAPTGCERQESRAAAPSQAGAPLRQPSEHRSERQRAIKQRIARRRAEPGWRAAVLDEGASRHVFSSASE